MPGKKAQYFESHLYTVTPKDFLPRNRFPFFFEFKNYSFMVELQRVDNETPWATGGEEHRIVYLGARQENGQYDTDPYRVPELNIGETGTINLDNIYVADPGQTQIGIVQGGWSQSEPANWIKLYSYRVRTQESLWVSIAVGMFAVATLAVSICNVW